MINLDLTKNGSDNLTTLIRALNPKAPSASSTVSYSSPTTYTPPAGSTSTANTQVNMTAVTGKGFKDTVVVKYRRLSLATETSKVITAVIIPADMRDPAMILRAVAGYYKILTSEITWVTPPSPPAVLLVPTTTTAKIQSSKSLIYLDGQATIKITWDNRTLLDLSKLGIPIKLGY